MNGKLCVVLVCCVCLCRVVLCVNVVQNSTANEGDIEYDGPGPGAQELKEVDYDGVAVEVVEKSQMNSTLQKTAKRFYCSVNNLENSYLLVYGTNSWTFPRQDVNLTLSYPSSNHHEYLRTDNHDYIITGLEVILFVDGRRSRGYITSGGILQRTISLSFVTSNITMLSYQFWLHGTPAVSTSGVPVEYNTFYLC